MKYRKMLVPLDTTRYAECVLDHVKEIATARAIPEVVLYTVVEPIAAAVNAYLGDDGVRESERRSVAAMRDYLQHTKTALELTGSKVTVEVEIGRPAQKILDYIDRNGVDIVVMAKHSRSDAERLFVGSVTDRVLRESSAPVFLIPSPACGG